VKLSISRGASKKVLGLNSKRKKVRGGERSKKKKQGKNKRKKFRHILHPKLDGCIGIYSRFAFDIGIPGHHLNSPTLTYTSFHFAQHSEEVEEGQRGGSEMLVESAFSVLLFTFLFHSSPFLLA